ncbi:Mechanosensitive ion channel-domain-containing protein [Schizophyllum fasciatum]
MNPFRSPTRAGYDAVELGHPSQIHDSPQSTPRMSANMPLYEYSLSGQGQRPNTGESARPDSEDTHVTYPPYSQNTVASSSSLPMYEARRGEPSAVYPPDGKGPPTSMPRPRMSRSPSWDILNGIKRFENGYEEFDTRKATEEHLAFAEGDLPKNKFSRFYHYLINVSIVTRWILFIVPVMGLIWIPGILHFTEFPDATVWSVNLLWWSVWLSVVWGGWWSSLAGALLLPGLLRSTIGVVAVSSRRYIDWMSVLHRYVARSDASDESRRIIDLIAKILFGFFLCAGLLVFEKFSIQWIAGKFHERSYAERIADQKFTVRALVVLYRHSSDIPGRHDTMNGAQRGLKEKANPARLLKAAIKGVRNAATTTTTALGNVASEIAGSSVLQPNSPQAMVKTALESANKSRQLARRIFYSFAKPGADYMFLQDIQHLFPDDIVDRVFSIFDRDGNGDASREEVEMALMDCHREQLSIEHSMQDLDSAVGRLDNILMSLYVIVAILIIAVCLEAELVTLVTSAGTLILGLSWLIGSSLAEVLTSIIFLFIKHPFDVGDQVSIAKEVFTVKEIRLLSTIFLDSNGVFVQAPNTQLNTLFLYNIRRSPQLSETFAFDVAYSTTFEQLEELRSRMIAFLKAERRDYLPSFDVNVVEFPDQEKMSLTADIMYKSISQQVGLRAKRRNKWVCALKTMLGEVGIYGSKGNPDVAPSAKRYTQVPWELVQEEDRKREEEEKARVKGVPEPVLPFVGWRLADKDAQYHDPIAGVFGETTEMYTTSSRGPSRAPTPRRQMTDDSLRYRRMAAGTPPPMMPQAVAGSSSPRSSPRRPPGIPLRADSYEMMSR